jgi:hypothetical protein
MKIFVPSLKISETDGFKSEFDIFKRKSYGESLYNLINNTDDELVLALDAPWGEGKSTFIQMWRGLLAEKTITNIYFDAFENDYQKDAFLAISSQLYELIEESDVETKTEFKDKALSVFNVVGRAGLRIGIRALTVGALDEIVLNSSADDVSEEASSLIDGLIEKQLTAAKGSRESLEEFKRYLSSLGEKLGKDKKLVFIIDELDRCKPKFALSILEAIKHLYSVPNITFVLVMNRKQIEESIRHEYGSRIDAEKYLQKFISIWTALPKPNEPSNSVIKTYIVNCLKEMGFEIKTSAHESTFTLFQDLAIHYDLSLREIEKSLTNYALIYNASKEVDLQLGYLCIAVYLSIIKTIHGDAFIKVSKANIQYKDLVIQTNLQDLKNSYWNHAEDHEIKWFLRYTLSTVEEADAMIKQLSSRSFHTPSHGAISYLLGLMSTFS